MASVDGSAGWQEAVTAGLTYCESHAPHEDEATTVRRAVRSCGIKQEAVANAAGIKSGNFSRFMNARQGATAETLAKIKSALASLS